MGWPFVPAFLFVFLRPFVPLVVRPAFFAFFWGMARPFVRPAREVQPSTDRVQKAIWIGGYVVALRITDFRMIERSAIPIPRT
jgi:hypothetical protein